MTLSLFFILPEQPFTLREHAIQNMKKTSARDKLLRAATDLFYRKGYAATTIQDIGKKAGISSSLIYHYFATKEDLLFEIVEATRDSFEEVLLKIQQDTPNPLDCLREIVRVTVIHPNKKAKKETKVFLDENYWLTKKHKERVKQRERELYEILLTKVRESQKQGLAKDLPATIVAFNIIGIINWSYRWYQAKGHLTIEEIASVIVQFVMEGIAASNSQPTY